MAVAYANDERSALATVEVNEVNPDGFKSVLETSNAIHQEAEGHLKDEHTHVITGSYSYKSPEGKNIVVSYTADENGYHPKVEQ